MSVEPFITAAEVAERLGFEAGTILDWWEAGRIPGYRFGAKGGRVRFRWSEIEAELDNCRLGHRH